MTDQEPDLAEVAAIDAHHHALRIERRLDVVIDLLEQLVGELGMVRSALSDLEDAIDAIDLAPPPPASVPPVEAAAPTETVTAADPPAHARPPRRSSAQSRAWSRGRE